MKLGFDLRERSSMRRVLRFALIAVILGFGVNALLSLFMDRDAVPRVPAQRAR